MARFLASAFVIALAACGNGSQVGPSGAQATSTTPLSEASPGALGPGRYVTTVFAPQISFELEGGWQMELPELENGVFLSRSDPEVFLSIMRPTAIFDIEEDGSHGPPLEVPGGPQGLADHLMGLEALRATPAEDLAVGGRHALRFDIDATDLSGFAGGDGDRFILLAGLPPDPLDREPISFGLDEGTKARVTVIEGDESPLLVVADAEASIFDSRADASDAFISSIRFEIGL